MLKIENVDVYGWDAAIRGMRNPKNSWDKSDSFICKDEPMTNEEINATCGICTLHEKDLCPYDDREVFVIGHNDHKLMMQLANAGDDHGKFMRMVNVTLDIVAPLYWWKEFDTYKVGTVADSCSTMHKIHAKEFTLDDFSIERLAENDIHVFNEYMCRMEANRKMYLALDGEDAKDAWYRMIQLLPTSYNQRRTVQLNYQVLKHMYHARKTHKLDEWRTFCKWIETLPYSELICG